jgi:hypothetical protein
VRQQTILPERTKERDSLEHDILLTGSVTKETGNIAG